MRLPIIYIALLLLASPVSASEGDAAEHHFHRNEISVLIGATNPVDEEAGGGTGFTFGIDYERRLTETSGVILLVDFVTGDHNRDDLFALQYSYRPIEGLRIGLGPGLEIAEEDTPAGTTSKTHFVVVTRANFDFHWRELILAPTLGIDFVGETKTNFVYGITIATGF